MMELVLRDGRGLGGGREGEKGVGMKKRDVWNSRSVTRSLWAGWGGAQCQYDSTEQPLSISNASRSGHSQASIMHLQL